MLVPLLIVFLSRYLSFSPKDCQMARLRLGKKTTYGLRKQLSRRVKGQSYWFQHLETNL